MTEPRVGAPDRTGLITEEWCYATTPGRHAGHRFMCTMPDGHDGPHVAGDGEHIVAVWRT